MAFSNKLPFLEAISDSGFPSGNGGDKKIWDEPWAKTGLEIKINEKKKKVFKD